MSILESWVRRSLGIFKNEGKGKCVIGKITWKDKTNWEKIAVLLLLKVEVKRIERGGKKEKEIRFLCFAGRFTPMENIEINRKVLKMRLNTMVKVKENKFENILFI